MTNTAKHTPELDICVSDNSNFIHIEEKVSGRNIATMTMKGGTREEEIAYALKFAAAPELLDALKNIEPVLVKVGIELEKIKHHSPNSHKAHDVVNQCLAFSSQACAVIAKAEGK